MYIARQLVSSILIIASISGFSKMAKAEPLMDKITESKRPIVLFGASSTALRPGTKTYSEILEQTFQEKNIPIEVINAGVPGNTTALALQRFQKDVLDHNPSLVVIQFGINDSAVDVWKDPPKEKPRVELPAFLMNMESMIDRIQDQNGEVILMSPQRMSWSKKTRELYGKPPYVSNDEDGFNVILDTYVAGLRELAVRKKVRFIDINAAYSKHPSDYGEPYSELLNQDGMHPNDKGHKLVFNLLIEQLSRPISKQ
jgi:lysophospholipase L1-like esterase